MAALDLAEVFMQARILGLVLLLVGATGALADDMKMPVNPSQLKYKIPAHNHPTTEMVTVISGNLHLGNG